MFLAVISKKTITEWKTVYPYIMAPFFILKRNMFNMSEMLAYICAGYFWGVKWGAMGKSGETLISHIRSLVPLNFQL